MNDPNLQGQYLDYYKLTQPIYENAWPPVIKCPNCTSGVCTLEVREIDCKESAKSLSLKHERFHEPEWLSGNFSAGFKCASSACSESLVIIGSWSVEETYDDALMRDNPGPYERVIVIEYVNPTLNLVGEFSGSIPPEVLTRVMEASKLLWADPRPAGTRIRLAIEDLLTALDVLPNKRTDRRSRDFASVNRPASEALMAIKWIGNDAKHEANLNHLNIFNALEILKHALTLIYPSDHTRIEEIIKSINTRTRGQRP
jgi:hypothetical protein